MVTPEHFAFEFTDGVKASFSLLIEQEPFVADVQRTKVQNCCEITGKVVGLNRNNRFAYINDKVEIVEHPLGCSPLELRDLLVGDRSAMARVEQNVSRLLGDCHVWATVKEPRNGKPSFRYLNYNEPFRGKTANRALDFIENNGFALSNTLLCNAKALKTMANCYTIVYRRADGSVESFQHISPDKIRAVKRKEDEARTTQYAIKLNKGYDVSKAQFAIIPAFNPKLGINNPPVFIVHNQDHLVCSEYYGYPNWLGAIRLFAIRRKIEEFHLNSITNGLHLKYVIKVPIEIAKDQLERLKSDNSNDTTTLNDLKAEIASEFQKVLKGKSSAAFTTFTKSDGYGKITGVEIEQISGTNHDEQYTKMMQLYETYFGQSFGSNNTSMGVGGSSGQQLNSGNEVRNFFNQSISEQKIHRRLLFGFMDAIKVCEGWPLNLCFTVADEYMVTGDINHSGMDTQLKVNE